MSSPSCEEIEQETSLKLYKDQLMQVDQAIQISGEVEDLVQLRNDLKELITLTEESLLQTKKARLLQSLGEQTADESNNQSQRNPNDDEYAAFQASIAQLSSPQSSPVQPSSTSVPENGSKITVTSFTDSHLERDDSESSDNEEEDDDNEKEDIQSALLHMIGTKCQAPIKTDWSGHHYGNAMIWSIDSPSEVTTQDEYKVQVIFLNPTQPSMVPCSYYMDDKCRFSSETCRRSHGQTVLVSELKPYKEPDHSQICSGARCLAKSSDDVWYPATVTDVCDDHLVNVKFDSGGSETTVNVEHVTPIEDEESDDQDSSSDSEEDEASTSKKVVKDDIHDDEDDDEGLPVYLWKPSGTTERLGAWEDFTKGVGSKLMAKMGYVTGQGLGPRGDGRAEPVPIMLLPQGKSLDKIMELKEMSGNADLFNAMKKMEKRQKILEKKEADKERRQEAKSNWGVFGFLNKKLHDHATHKSGPSHGGQGSKTSKSVVTHTTVRELEKRSDKDVNIQIFKTAEEIRSVERQLHHLRQQLARNESRDRKMAAQVKAKIEEQETYLQQLKSSSNTLESHKKNRSAHKKLTIF